MIGSRLLRCLHGRLVFRRRALRLARAVGRVLPSTGTVLDVGCGDGLVAARLAAQRPGLSIVGIDVAARPTCHVPMALYDGMSIPAADGAVDVALVVDVLHHVPTLEATFAEAVRVSRGSVIVKDHVCNGRLGRWVLRFMDWVGNRPHGVDPFARYLGRGEWEDLWSRLGLRLESFDDRLRLYPFPFSLVFGRRLHFLAVLSRET